MNVYRSQCVNKEWDQSVILPWFESVHWWCWLSNMKVMIMECRAMNMCSVRSWIGINNNYIIGISKPNLPICNFCGATMTTTREAFTINWFLVEKNFSSPKNDIFRRKWSECDILVSCLQHCMSLCGTAFFDIFCIKIQGGVLAEAERKNQKSRVSKSVCGVGHATTTAGSPMRLVRLKPQGRAPGQPGTTKVYVSRTTLGP